MMNGMVNNIASRLKELREVAGLSQQALAVKAGLSISVVSQIEQGKKPDPRSSTALALARALDVPLEALLGGGEQKPKRK